MNETSFQYFIFLLDKWSSRCGNACYVVAPRSSSGFLVLVVLDFLCAAYPWSSFHLWGGISSKAKHILATIFSNIFPVILFAVHPRNSISSTLDHLIMSHRSLRSVFCVFVVLFSPFFCASVWKGSLANNLMCSLILLLQHLSAGKPALMRLQFRLCISQICNLPLVKKKKKKKKGEYKHGILKVNGGGS